MAATGAFASSIRVMKYGAKMIAESTLEAVDNDNPQRDYQVAFTIPEFTCLCPRSNFPDFATIRITYVPDRKLVELNSLQPGAAAAAIFGSDRVGQRHHPDPAAPGGEVAGDLAQRRKSNHRPIGTDAGRVHSAAADDTDTPAAI